jgi:hypothetical protein
VLELARAEARGDGTAVLDLTRACAAEPACATVELLSISAPIGNEESCPK